ncbi:MAG: ABC transporter substrate-binding protein [Desulfobacteraceae bacterium]|nr:ABC transporter substrate-binding protein [Desulfobacteraceae bacterium]
MNRIRFFVFFVIMTFAFSTAFAEDTINIAVIYALTGPAAEDNTPSLLGVRIGAEEINKQGGIIGKKINLLMFDNLSTPIGSDIAAEKAAESGVTAILGASWSSHSIAIARVAQSGQIPMISNVSTNPKVTKIGNYIFRVCFTDDFQGSVMARFARKDLNAATAVIFTDLTSDFSLKLSEIFRKDFEHSGGKVVTEVRYKHKQKNFDRQIQQAEKAGSDVLFLSGHDETGLIVRQARDLGISSVPLSGDGWSSPSFMLKGGSELKQGYYCTHWSESADSEISRSFVRKYNNIENFDVGTALAYDAVMVLADAITCAGSTDRDKIRDALANTHSFKGVTGTISLDANGDPVKNAVIMEISNGKPHYFKTVEP